MKFSDASWSPDMHPAIWSARVLVQIEFEKWTGKEFVITSGVRPPNPHRRSKHATGEALDFRTRGMFNGPDDERAFSAHLGTKLGPDYDVVLEGPNSPDPQHRNKPPHGHVEYDPKGRQNTPVQIIDR